MRIRTTTRIAVGVALIGAAGLVATPAAHAAPASPAARTNVSAHTAAQARTAAHAHTAAQAHAAADAFGHSDGASGSDASCPPANPATAGSATPSAPTLAHAIGGESSATVLWCPPASGAAHVTSYTVTASPGGQQVTAQVPNDWAIVQNLTNGTRYTFTVTANTTSPKATTNPVTPEPIAPPRNVQTGKPQTVSYDRYSMLIGGQRVFITAGEFDPWRTPSPSLWLDDLQKMKADGYNAVTVYFDWDYNSPSPGVYDFSQTRDMNELLNLAQQAGLYVIARPGPYINAETDGGGIPGWVLTVPNGYRSDTQPYEATALQWFSEIDPIIAAHQITKGGNVIAYQIENEYTGQGTPADQYMADLEQQATKDGITVPFTFNQCCGAQTFTTGLGAVNISGTDNYPLGFDCANTTSFGQPFGYPSYPGEPIYLPEFQGGSFDGWGGSGYDNCYTMTGPSFENVYYKNDIAQGVTMQSNYMGVGGTNWGWLPANFVYSSYDYGAAIRETGEIGTPADPNHIEGSKFGENKLINDFETSAAPLAQTAPAAGPTPDNPAIATMGRVNPSNGAEFVYLRQADTTSTATTSTHIALNTDEAAGYTYDDADTALTYAGAWTHAGPSAGYTNGDFDQTESWSTQAGASMKVTFTGTAVQWVGPKNNNGGIATVSVDGGPATNVDTFSPAGKLFQQVLYTGSGLSAGSHTLTITVTGNKNPSSSADTVVVDAINVPTAAQLAAFFPVVPQSGTITLDGRDSRLLVANYKFGGQDLVYSTSELMNQQTIGSTDTAVLYDPSGTDGETVLNYTSQPAVTAPSGVRSTWDAATGNLRLDYTHNGLQEVEITGGGRPALTLLIADTNTAEGFWPEGSVLVEGAYLIRTAEIRGDVLTLSGDTSQSGAIRVWAPATVRSLEWNGTTIAVTSGADGSLSGTLPGQKDNSLPSLNDWRFSSETPEVQPGFDDSGWTLADHPANPAAAAQARNAANATVKNSDGTVQPGISLGKRGAAVATAGPILYASDYGYDHGFTWYRGHFTATGSETGVTLTADGVSPTGAFSVWLNGAFLGSHAAPGPTSATFTFPAGAISSGSDNVIAVLVENTGNPEGPTGEPTGLYSAALTGSAAAVTWRLMGAPGGTSLQDPVRGIMNATGLFGTDNGWHLPGYPDGNWQPVTLPDKWASRGVPDGVGWYRTTFNLDISGYVPIDVQVGNGVGAAGARAFVFVNGWLVGRYVGGVGPQYQFYVPAGVLNDHGPNTLAIAVWGLDSASGGLPAVSLVAAGNQASGFSARPVYSPGYNAAVYGPPTAPQPTLAAVASSALAAGTFQVKTTLRNPTRVSLTRASVSLSVPSGWTVSPSGPASLGNVAPGGSASETFSVTAPTSGLTPGDVSLLARATFTSGFGRPQSLINAVQVSVPYASLSATFDNSGITSNSDVSPSPGFLGFDGIGTAYSAEGLAADGIAPGGTVSAGGLRFAWPSAAAAQPDNTMAMGQTIAISGSGSNLGFLAAANNSPESGTGTIYYTDGSTQSFTLSVGNFWYPPGSNGNPSNTQVAAVNYANYPTGSSGHTVYVFEVNVALAAGKTVAAVTLPSLGNVAGYNPALHIFAMAIG
ncbi:MAG TPA: beta-galactosidase [Streptosporangiaceae bacterium]